MRRTVPAVRLDLVGDVNHLGEVGQPLGLTEGDGLAGIAVGIREQELEVVGADNAGLAHGQPQTGEHGWGIVLAEGSQAFQGRQDRGLHLP